MILRVVQRAFPESVERFRRDLGFAPGPRPALLRGTPERIGAALRLDERFVVLTRDPDAAANGPAATVFAAATGVGGAAATAAIQQLALQASDVFKTKL